MMVRVTRTGLRAIVPRGSRYYIRRTCTGEIKDNAKKKIQRRIARGAGGVVEGGRDERVDR